MNLCFVNPADVLRQEVYELAKHLVRESKHKVTILLPMYLPKKAPEQTYRISGLKIVYLPSLFLQKTNYTIPNFFKQYQLLNKVLKDEDSEIIQVCDYDYLTSIVPVLIKKFKNIPSIITNDALPGYSWYYGDTVVDTAAKFYTFSLGKLILESYDRVTTLFGQLADDIKRLGIEKQKIRVIPNGVNVKQFSKNKNKAYEIRKKWIKNDDKIVLFVGRLVKVKRVDWLIRIANILMSEGIRFRLIIVGEGSFRKYFEEIAKSLDSNVIFTGKIPYDKIAAFYSIADVFLLPSLSEGLPTVLLEAAASELPIVATNTGGISEIVMHGKTGFLAEKWDIDAYVKYTKLLLKNDDLAQRMGTNARKHIRENFSWTRVIRKYEDIYAELIN